MSSYQVAVAYTDAHFPGEPLHTPSDWEWHAAERVTGSPIPRHETPPETLMQRIKSDGAMFKVGFQSAIEQNVAAGGES